MKKIPTLFQRDPNTHQLIPTVVPEAAWVIEGEGVATRKYDGTPLMIKDHLAYRRYERKKDAPAPPEWIPAQEAPDPITGEWPGWVLIGAGPEDEYFREAITHDLGLDGTYEVIGPKVNGNPERQADHRLVRHGENQLGGYEVPRTFEGLKFFLANVDIEGIVWHHPDGRMAKIKGKDFGLKRGVK